MQYLEQAVELINDDPTISEHSGDAYEKVGRIIDASRAYRAAHQAVAAARGVCVLVVPPVPRPGGAAQELREALQRILRAHMYPESFGDDLSVAMARAYTLLQTDDQPLTGGE